jgi:acetyltransferase-like isoleucine patch superfamily enzyme
MHGEQNFTDIDEPPLARNLSSKGIISIENNVWIGENAVILGGVNIGANSIIAACSLVNKDIPCNCIAAGVPAKVVKQLK